jgi:hypothetical protein
MAVIKLRPQKPKKTSEGYIQRKQLNTGCLMKKVRLTFPNRVPPEKTKRDTRGGSKHCQPYGTRKIWNRNEDSPEVV